MPELAAATVLQEAGFSVGQQHTKPRAGSASGLPEVHGGASAAPAVPGKVKGTEEHQALGVSHCEDRVSGGSRLPGFVVQVMADLLEQAVSSCDCSRVNTDERYDLSFLLPSLGHVMACPFAAALHFNISIS